ncbi:MAG: O-antigen ligase family protein, partial [Myxococcota bacterium]
RREERWHLGLGLGLPVAGLALASLAFGLRGAVGRFAGLLHGGDVSVTSRAQVWRESFDAFLDAPIFGHGLGSFRLVWAVHERGSHLYDFDHAHSEPVEILVELGAVGALAVAVALAAWLRGLALDADVAPQGARTAIGAGLAVGVLAVALQSLGDFPLRIPGVALLFALTAGVARGALRPPEDVKASRVAAAPVAIAGAGALLLGALAALADAPFDGTRKERIGEVHRVWFAGESVRTLSRARAWRVQAEAAAAESPLDPWAHAAVARASALVAAGEWKLDGGTPEEDAWRADRAAARALALRPRSPRLEIALAGAFTALARTSPTPDAWRERAVRLLSDAVARDAWRAQDALAVAGGLAEADLARIAGASTAEGRPRARVRYEYGQVLAKRGRKAEALAAHREAAAADPTFGPPAFQAGVLLRGVDDEEAARMLRHFLQTRDRPLAMEGWALLMLDEVDNAEARFRRAVQEAPANRWAWEGVAEVARRRGDARREMEAWQRILAIAPDDAQVRARIASIQARAD